MLCVESPNLTTYILLLFLLKCFAYTYIPLDFVCLRNKAPLRSTANKAGKDVMGLTQMCTIVGMLNFNRVVSWFNTVRFRTTVARHTAMYVLTCHAELWHHLKGSGDVTVPHDVIKQRVYKGLCNDAWGWPCQSCRSHWFTDLVVLAPFVSLGTLDRLFWPTSWEY